MKKFTNHIVKVGATALAISIFTPSFTYATNGMFLIGTGTKSRGMGGVGLTQGHDVMTSAVNPANLSQLTVDRFDIGGDIFMADAEAYQGQAPNTLRVESKPNHATLSDGVYLMPAIGAAWVYDDSWSYGVTMVPVGGGGSRYSTNLFNCANATPLTDPKCSDPLGVDLFVVNINPTVSYKIDKQNSVGATLVIGIQQFRAQGLAEFSKFTTSGTSDKLTNNGFEFSYGAGIRLGWLGNYNYNGSKLTVGAAFTSATYMSRFDKYTELFAEQGRLNTPGNIGLGISYEANKELTVAFDLVYIRYSDSAAISNPGPTKGPGSPFPVDSATNGLGKDQGLGFNWENQLVYKLGAVYNLNPEWELRAGWNYAESPIDEKTDILFSTVAPAVTQHHLTLGGTYKMDKDMELSFSYVHAFEYEQFGPTYINFEGGYKMSQNAFGASFGMLF